MQNGLEQGPDFCCWFDTTQFSYQCVHLYNTCKGVFNPNVTTFSVKLRRGLLVLFIFTVTKNIIIIKSFKPIHIYMLAGKDVYNNCIIKKRV